MDFFKEYELLAERALNYGGQNLPNHSDIEDFMKDPRRRTNFITACHRGFEKAQRLALELLSINQDDQTIDDQKKVRRELLVRKVIDAIAYTILFKQTHAIRRLCFHDRAPGIDINTVKAALSVSEHLNSESRKTFALVCDMSTTIHVCDLLRIDYRSTRPKLEMIELKTGTVNAILLDQLSEYQPEPASIEKINADQHIEDKHRKQAVRMMRQKIRLEHTEQILSTDCGIDIKSHKPTFMSHDTYLVDTYDSFLRQLCDQALEMGYACGTVHNCLHLSVAYREQRPTQARMLAAKGLSWPMFLNEKNAPQSFQAVHQKFESMIPKQDRYTLNNMLITNLASVACMPFLVWGLRNEHKLLLAKGQLCIYAGFDVIFFIWLALQLGLQINMSSRSEAEETIKRIGRSQAVTWGKRCLVVRDGESQMTIAGGMMNRLFNNLICPASLIKLWQGSNPIISEPKLPFKPSLKLLE